MKYLAAQPSIVDFGSVYRGSHIAGSFQILGARKVKSLKCYAEPGDARPKEGVLPGWLVLGEPRQTGQEGLAWQFRMKSTSTGYRSASLRFELDNGTCSVQIRATIKAGTPRLGDLVICDSPYDCHTDMHSLQTLTRVLQGLDFRLHYLDSITPRLPRRPHTILLHGSGLARAAHENLRTLTKLVDAGTNLILLADKFFKGTAEAANLIGEKYGIRLRDGREGPFASVEQLEHASHRRSDESQIRRHPLTKGVRHVSWQRPWPIDCLAKSAIPLVTDAEDPERCYLAVAKPKGYVIVLSMSLLSSMTSVGWPFDNDRLLANLLAGGDAEGQRVAR